MSRAARSAVVGKLAPTQTLWAKYSLADFGNDVPSAYFSSPIEPLRTLATMPSRCCSIGANWARPDSVITNFRRGKRSNTPDNNMWTRLRFP